MPDIAPGREEIPETGEAPPKTSANLRFLRGKKSDHHRAPHDARSQNDAALTLKCESQADL